MNHTTSSEIELAVSRYFDARRNIIVPNVWWGMGLNHECDLFVLTPVGYAYEVEIKISKVDLKADLNKRWGHKIDRLSTQIRKLYFAIPEDLRPCIYLIPDHAGILSVQGTFVKKIREATNNKDAKPLNIKKQLKLAHLGTMRIWKMKADIQLMIRNNEAKTKRENFHPVNNP